jgi:hypothetical protein
MPPVYRHLCAPFKPGHLYGPLFQQYSQDNEWLFSIRPVCINQDMDILADWVAQLANREQLSHKAIRDMKKDHSKWLRSKGSQSFLCFVGKIPLLQIDIHDARIHLVSVAFKVGQGDYYIEFIYPLKNKRSLNKMAFAMQGFVEYVKMFPEVKRIVYRIGPGNDMGEKIIIKNQFKFKAIIEEESMPFSVYVLDLEDTPPLPSRPLLTVV